MSNSKNKKESPSTRALLLAALLVIAVNLALAYVTANLTAIIPSTSYFVSIWLILLLPMVLIISTVSLKIFHKKFDFKQNILNIVSLTILGLIVTILSTLLFELS